MLAQLRSHTGHLHSKVEEALNAQQLTDGNLRKEEYQNLLSVNYLIFKALKERLHSHPELSPLFIDRVGDLKQDLDQLNFEPAMPDGELFYGWSTGQLTGALYVLNGSSVGGHMIARQLEGYDWTGNPKFYRSSPSVMKKWRSFKKYLENMETGNAESEQIIDGAKQTYGYFIFIHEELNKAR